MDYEFGKPLSLEDASFYSRRYIGLTATGETIVKRWCEHGCECSITKVVFKGGYTPYGAIRDCGDHYIEALYSRYLWISKDLMCIINDVEDQ